MNWISLSLKNVRIAIGVLILLYGIILINFESYKWIVLTILIFSLPLFFQFINNKIINIYFLWFGIFLVLQSFVPVDVIPEGGFKTLKPLTKEVIYVESGLPGIRGRQVITTDSKGFRTTKTRR